MPDFLSDWRSRYQTPEAAPSASFLDSWSSRYLTPDPVAEYIRSHRLYQAA